MHGLDHGFILVRAGDGEDFRELGADQVRLVAHAAGDNHPAIFGNRLADRGKAFLFRAVEESAGVDQHNVGAFIVGRHGIAIGAQLGQDAFAVDQRLGAAEADHADALLVGDLGGILRCHGGGPLHCPAGKC